MFRTDPQHLCWSMQEILGDKQYHQVSVPQSQQAMALVSLNHMLDLG